MPVSVFNFFTVTLSIRVFPQDGGTATQNIMLQALDSGYGTCWCGVYPREPLMAKIRVLYGIPENKIPFNIIAVDKTAESPASRGFYDETKVKFVG